MKRNHRRYIAAAVIGAAVALAASVFLYFRNTQRAPRKPAHSPQLIIDAGWFTAGWLRSAEFVGNEQGNLFFNAFHDCVAIDPVRRLWLSRFAIDERFVTDAELDCERSWACKPKIEDEYDGPAIVRFELANEYCQSRGMQLPTQAQWKKTLTVRPELSQDTWEWVGDAIDLDNKKIFDDNAPEDPDWQEHYYFSSCPAILQIGHHKGPGSDWWFVDPTSVRQKWHDARVIDPVIAPGPGRQSPADVSPNTCWPLTTIGEPSTRKARFRCVQQLAGPPPPNVQAPSNNVCSEPFREPGFEWPRYDEPTKPLIKWSRVGGALQ